MIPAALPLPTRNQWAFPTHHKREDCGTIGNHSSLTFLTPGGSASLAHLYRQTHQSANGERQGGWLIDGNIANDSDAALTFYSFEAYLRVGPNSR